MGVCIRYVEVENFNERSVLAQDEDMGPAKLLEESIEADGIAMASSKPAFEKF